MYVPTRASPLDMVIYAFQSMGYMSKARGQDTVGREVRGAVTKNSRQVSECGHDSEAIIRHSPTATWG